MPASKDYTVPLGAGGLNLRDSPVEVPVSDLVDSLNWRLDERGALVKRLGWDAYSATQTSEAITELAIYRKAGATVQLIAACSNGTVQRSPGDGVWTNIKTGLNGSRPAISQLNELLLYSNQSDGLQKWDGTTWAAVGGCPIKPTLLSVWRGRLWASGDPAFPKRVAWSARLDPTTWPALNYVDIPGPLDDPVTAIAHAPDTGSGFDGADALLVFHRFSTHAIYDDTDNAAGIAIGGSNREIDGGRGCVSPRSIAYGDGRMYLLATDGIYSTDGRTVLKLESAKLGRWLIESLSATGFGAACGVIYQGSYFLAVSPVGAAGNTLTLELYMRMPRDGQDQAPIMPHTIPAAAFAIYPSAAGDMLYFADASAGDTRYVRRAFMGGTDLSGTASISPVTASARTGSSDFGWARRKRAKLIRMIYRGIITIGVVADLADSVGETQTFSAPATALDLWDKTNDRFGTGVWGGGSGGRVSSDAQAYTRDGRRFSFTVNESSDGVSTARRALGIAGQPAGGAAIYDLSIRITPLNRE